MGIKHSAVKATGEKGYASEWNADHVVDDNVDFNSKKITSLATPTENTDGATKKYVDDNIGGATALSQLAIDVSKNWQGYQIKNLADPTLDQDAATKFYVDSATGTPPVLSVFGRTGDVVATTNDYTWAQVNKTVSNIADITTKSHTSLTDKGTNTHAQIDTHLASAANPHSVTYTQVGAIQNAADTVKDTHVDWGTGASQVSADDVPDGITNKMLTNQAQTIAGVKTFSSFPLTPSSAPTTDYQTANKKYVDDAGAMVQHANEWHTPDMVDLSTNQAVGGTKTFTVFPFTPSAAPTSNYEVANKKYVDDNARELIYSNEANNGAIGAEHDLDSYTIPAGTFGQRDILVIEVFYGAAEFNWGARARISLTSGAYTLDTDWRGNAASAADADVIRTFKFFDWEGQSGKHELWGQEVGTQRNPPAGETVFFGQIYTGAGWPANWITGNVTLTFRQATIPNWMFWGWKIYRISG